MNPRSSPDPSPPTVDHVPGADSDSAREAQSHRHTPQAATVEVPPVSSLATAAAMFQTAAYPAPPGYELRDAVGEGGMGIVFRARDHRLDREVAVKILQPRHALNSAIAARFVAEAKITGQLQHPGIPPVYHVGTLEDGRPFLAMKLIKGLTLDQLLKAKSPVAYLPVFEAICHAVGYAHAHNVIHRDLKPANVMVGAFGEVQVMDWGLAKVLVDGASATDMELSTNRVETIPPTEIRHGRYLETSVGSILGTPSYMAPEQAAGEIAKITPRTDVFGLGAILCTMLTGQPPYTGKDSDAIRVAAVRGETGDALQRLDTCGAEPELVALCKWCLKFDPADRPAHGNELAHIVADLRAAAEERAKQAELETAKAEVREAEQRTRRRVVRVAGLAVMCILLAGIIGTTWGLFRADDQRQQAEEARVKEAAQRRLAEDEKAKAIAARNDAEAAQRKTLHALRLATEDVASHLIDAKQAMGPSELAFLDTALQRWHAYADLQGDTPQAKIMRAEGVYRVAKLRAKYGQNELAETGYMKAITDLEKLAAAFPALAEPRFLLAGSHQDLGELWEEEGKLAEARTQFERALALLTRLAEEYPGVPDYRQGMAKQHDNMGLVHRQLGPLEEARRQYARALELRQQLEKEFPAVPDYQRDVALTYNQFGFLLGELQLWGPAIEHHRLATQRCAKLVAQFPAVPNYRATLAAIHTNLGILFGRLQRWEEARAQFTLALSLQLKLADEFPVVPEYRIYLGGNYCNLGTVCSQTQKHDEARRHYEKAITYLEPAWKQQKRHQHAKTFLIASRGNLAATLDVMGRHGQAVNEWKLLLGIVPQAEQGKYRAAMAYAQMRSGGQGVNRALEEVEELTKTDRWTAEQWYNFAAIYAVATSKTPQRRRSLEQANRAMELLHQAVKAGFKDVNNLKNNVEFEALRNRDDFKKLVESLSAPTK